jgi:hypothetical protein
MPLDILEPWGAFLRDLDRELVRPVELHCLGGFVVTLPLGEARDALQKWSDELAAILERASSLRRALPEAHGQGHVAVVLPPTLPL